MNDTLPQDTNAQQPDPAHLNDSDTSAATVILNLESLIKNNLTGIRLRKEELKKSREMLASILLNDATYQELDQKVKDAQSQKNTVKQQLMKSQAAQELHAKVTELTHEIKEMDEALSDYAQEYHRMSGNNEIETEDGAVHEIVYIAKLIRKQPKPTKKSRP